MPVEVNPTGIWDIDTNYPDGDADQVSLLDNYMRVRWQALLDTWPNLTSPITASSAEINKLDGIGGDLVGTTDVQTLTNKTIVAANNTINFASTDLSNSLDVVLNSDTTVAGSNWFKDEDNMASNSAVACASQQSIKAFVEAGAIQGIAQASSNVAANHSASANVTVLSHTYTKKQSGTAIMVFGFCTAKQTADNGTGTQTIDLKLQSDSANLGTIAEGTINQNTNGSGSAVTSLQASMSGMRMFWSQTAGSHTYDLVVNGTVANTSLSKTIVIVEVNF